MNIFLKDTIIDSKYGLKVVAINNRLDYLVLEKEGHHIMFETSSFSKEDLEKIKKSIDISKGQEIPLNTPFTQDKCSFCGKFLLASDLKPYIHPVDKTSGMVCPECADYQGIHKCDLTDVYTFTKKIIVTNYNVDWIKQEFNKVFKVGLYINVRNNIY